METEVRRQELFDQTVEAYLKRTSLLDSEEFRSYSLNRLVACYKEMLRWRSKDIEVMNHWSMHMDALIHIIEKRGQEDKRMMTSQDYRWSLTYVAKDKKYRLTETQLVASEWVINQTSWDSMGAALSYIDRTNKERQPIKTH